DSPACTDPALHLFAAGCGTRPVDIELEIPCPREQRLVVAVLDDNETVALDRGFGGAVGGLKRTLRELFCGAAASHAQTNLRAADGLRHQVLKVCVCGLVAGRVEV